MAAQLFMKFGMDVMPLEATPNPYFLRVLLSLMPTEKTVRWEYKPPHGYLGYYCFTFVAMVAIVTLVTTVTFVATVDMFIKISG
jgi:hypothetical protein